MNIDSLSESIVSTLKSKSDVEKAGARIRQIQYIDFTNCMVFLFGYRVLFV
jgi:hypothetical protein